MACRDMTAERYDASCLLRHNHQHTFAAGLQPPRLLKETKLSHLAVWEFVQEATLIDMLGLLDHIAIAAAAGGSDNVFVEGKGNEGRDDEQEDDCAEGASALGDLLLCSLGQVGALEADSQEGGRSPDNEGIRGREGETRQAEGREYRFCVGAQCAKDDGGANTKQQVQTEEFSAVELADSHGVRTDKEEDVAGCPESTQLSSLLWKERKLLGTRKLMNRAVGVGFATWTASGAVPLSLAH